MKINSKIIEKVKSLKQSIKQGIKSALENNGLDWLLIVILSWDFVKLIYLGNKAAIYICIVAILTLVRIMIQSKEIKALKEKNEHWCSNGK